VYLNRELNVAAHANPAARDNGAVNIVVLQADERQFGLVVDQINDTEEIVVKPLRKQLKTVKTFAGASIMGDGKVALILDVLGLAQRAKVITETSTRTLSEKITATTGTAAGKQTFLLFAGPGDSRMAILLSALARLEEFPAEDVEKSGDQWVIQYRGQILPLIRLSLLMEKKGERRGQRGGVLGLRIADRTVGHGSALVGDEVATQVGFVLDQQDRTGASIITCAQLPRSNVTDLRLCVHRFSSRSPYAHQVPLGFLLPLLSSCWGCERLFGRRP